MLGQNPLNILRTINKKLKSRKSKPEDALNYAVIGYGVAGEAHSRIVEELRSAYLIAVCDINPGRLSVASKNHPGVNMYEDTDKMILSEDLDVVSICTPHDTHYPLAVKCLENKIHVLTEKPIATDIFSADKMIGTASANGMYLGTISQYRYERAPRMLKKEIDRGQLGEIISTSVNVKWKKEDHYYRDTWKGKMIHAGGGVLINQAIHMIDLARWFNGEIVSVQSFTSTSRDYIDVEDNAVGIVKYSNGAFGTIDVSTSANPQLGTYIDVLGSNYSVKLYERKIIEWGNMNRKEINRFNKMVRNENKSLYGEPYFGYGHVSQIADFIYCVKYGRQPLLNGEEAKKTLRIILDLMNTPSNIG